MSNTPLSRQLNGGRRPIPFGEDWLHAQQRRIRNQLALYPRGRWSELITGKIRPIEPNEFADAADLLRPSDSRAADIAALLGLAAVDERRALEGLRAALLWALLDVPASKVRPLGEMVEDIYTSVAPDAPWHANSWRTHVLMLVIDRAIDRNDFDAAAIVAEALDDPTRGWRQIAAGHAQTGDLEIVDLLTPKLGRVKKTEQAPLLPRSLALSAIALRDPDRALSIMQERDITDQFIVVRSQLGMQTVGWVNKRMPLLSGNGTQRVLIDLLYLHHEQGWGTDEVKVVINDFLDAVDPKQQATGTPWKLKTLLAYEYAGALSGFEEFDEALEAIGRLAKSNKSRRQREAEIRAAQVRAEAPHETEKPAGAQTEPSTAP